MHCKFSLSFQDKNKLYEYVYFKFAHYSDIYFRTNSQANVFVCEKVTDNERSGHTCADIAFNWVTQIYTVENRKYVYIIHVRANRNFSLKFMGIYK